MSLLAQLFRPWSPCPGFRLVIIDSAIYTASVVLGMLSRRREVGNDDEQKETITAPRSDCPRVVLQAQRSHSSSTAPSTRGAGMFRRRDHRETVAAWSSSPRQIHSPSSGQRPQEAVTAIIQRYLYVFSGVMDSTIHNFGNTLTLAKRFQAGAMITTLIACRKRRRRDYPRIRTGTRPA